MANGLLSFAGGLAKGYMDNTIRNQDRERQAKLDAMREQEYGLRKRQLEGQIDDQDSERAIKKSLLEADQDLPEIQDGTSVQVNGALSGNTDAESAASSAQAVREANMQLAPQDQIPEAEAVPTKTVGKKSFLATPGGLSAAEAYRKDGNTEEGRIRRKADAIRQYRGSEAAQKFLTDWTTNQEALNAARLNVVKRVGLEKIAKRDFAGFADVYNHYNDGFTAVYEPGQDGSHAYGIYQGDPKDGKRTETIGFKDENELASMFVDRVDPLGAMKRKQAAAIEAAKPYDLSPGQERRSGDKIIAKNTTMTAAEARINALERGLVGGGSGRVGKPIGPDIVTMKSDSGDYLYDKNSGAVGREVPATEATPEERPWFGANKPAIPANPGGIQWKLPDGTPLPSGPQAIYQQLPANRVTSQGGAPKSTPQKGPAQPKTKAEYDALPKGAQYVKPGETQTRIKG